MSLKTKYWFDNNIGRQYDPTELIQYNAIKLAVMMSNSVDTTFFTYMNILNYITHSRNRFLYMG